MHPHSLMLLAISLLASADGAKQNEANQEDVKKLQGIWTAVSMDRGGIRATAQQLREAAMAVKRDKIVTYAGETLSEVTYSLDPAKTPRRIDFHQQRQGPIPERTIRGIYAFEGDRLKLCIRFNDDGN